MCDGDRAAQIMDNADPSVAWVAVVGLVSVLKDDVKQDFGVFMKALCTGNVDQLCRTLLSFHCDGEMIYSGQRLANFSGTPSERALATELFKADVQTAVRTYVSKSGSVNPQGGPIELGNVLGAVCGALQRHGVCLRADVASCIMSMGLIEGVIRSLSPDFDCVSKALPYMIAYGDSWKRKSNEC